MRRIAVTISLSFLAGIALTLAVLAWYLLRQAERQVIAFNVRAREIQAGDTEASVRARFGKPRDIIDAKVEPEGLARECRDESAARQVTYELETSCVDLLTNEPPKHLLFVCLNETGAVISARTTTISY